MISRSDLQQFVVHLRQRGVKPVTCNTWLRALNAFCRWLHEEGELTTLVKLAPQRLEKKLIATHGEAALRALLTFGAKDLSQRRVHALVLTILDTGWPVVVGYGLGVSTKQARAGRMPQVVEPGFDRGFLLSRLRRSVGRI